MADTVRERVFANVVTSLKNINGTGVYRNNLQNRVFRFGDAGFQEAAYPVVHVYEPTETMTWIAYANIGVIDCVSEFQVEAWAIGDPRGATLASTKVSNLVADIAIALLSDPTRGNDARETSFLSVESVVSAESQPAVGVRVRVRVNYRFDSTNPEQRR